VEIAEMLMNKEKLERKNEISLYKQTRWFPVENNLH